MAQRKPPWGTFWIGGAVGLALGLPLLSMLLYAVAAGVGVGDPATPIDRIGRIALAFAGFPAFLTGGGVARLAAHRTAELATDPRRALLASVLAMGAGGIGLAYLTAVPLGGMPEEPVRWIWLAVAGLTAGALTGLAIGGLVAAWQRRVEVVEPATAPAPEPEPVKEPELTERIRESEPEPVKEPASEPEPEPVKEPEPEPVVEAVKEPEPEPVRELPPVDVTPPPELAVTPVPRKLPVEMAEPIMTSSTKRRRHGKRKGKKRRRKH